MGEKLEAAFGRTLKTALEDTSVVSDCIVVLIGPEAQIAAGSTLPPELQITIMEEMLAKLKLKDSTEITWVNRKTGGFKRDDHKGKPN